MSEVQSIGSSGGSSGGGSGPERVGNVRAAIARAATRSGVDFDYLLAQARIESSLDPRARAATSSAAGLYQFTQGTWLRTLETHGAAHGLDWASAAIAGGRVRDPGLRTAILALRSDPDASAAMAAELAQDNAEALTPVLGRQPDAAELYLAHFLGSGGASQFLTALQSDPARSAASLLPAAAAANRSIFFEGTGAPRSVGAVMELLRGKVSAAMEQAPSPGGESLAGGWSQPIGRLPQAPHAADASRLSMADTLRDTFGLADAEGQASAPQFVRAAYGHLRSLGL